jgi:hypothetical protein
MFNEGTVSGPANIISVFSFSPHVVKQVDGICSHCISYPPSKFRQNGSQWWHPWCTPKRKNQGKCRPTGWPRKGPHLPIHFLGNMRFKKSVTSLWKCGVSPSCWNSMSSGPSSKPGMRNSSTWDATLATVSVALQMERFGNSSGTNHELHRVTYSNALIFHPSAFRFMSNVSVKWYTFHLYILYIT